MKYGKMDESKFSAFSKIICATADYVKMEFLCENAKKAIKEYAASEWRYTEDIDFQDQKELWQIYNFLGDHPLPIEDKSVEIISHFLKAPVIDTVINGDTYWLINWTDFDLLVWGDWNTLVDESIDCLMEDNFNECKNLWLRDELGEDITCDRNFDLYDLACRLGFKIKRLFENSDDLLVHLPYSGTCYESFYNEVPYETLSYAA